MRKNARLQSIDEKLGELDPIFLRFCSDLGFTFSRIVELYPRRRVWKRDEIDRCLDLAPAWSVSEVMARGFHSEMPWSLSASASLLPNVRVPMRILSVLLFEGLPFSQIQSVLAGQLDNGYDILRSLGLDDVITKGKVGRTV